MRLLAGVALGASVAICTKAAGGTVFTSFCALVGIWMVILLTATLASDMTDGVRR